MHINTTKIIIHEPIIKKIGEIANKHKYDVYVVGGYVRDVILNLPNKQDIDFSVIGNGVEFANIVAQELNTKAIIYENFGTALVPIGDFKIEFVGTRKETYYEGSRNPIITNGSLEEDLMRRDFTINTLAFKVQLESEVTIIDLFGGIEDLKNEILKTPLNPITTYNDDPLRMLRAARFLSRLNFKLEPNSFSAICELSNRINIITQERVSDELLKLLSTDKPSLGFKLLLDTGLLDIIFPELANLDGVDLMQVDGIGYAHKNVFYHTLQVIDNICKCSDNLWLRFAGMMHDIAKPKTKKFVEGRGWTFHGHEEVGARWQERIFRNMKFPFKRKEYVEKLIRLHHRPMALVNNLVTDSAIRRLCVDAGEDLDDLFLLCRADITSKDPKKIKQYLKNYDVVIEKIKDVREKDKLREFQSPLKGEEIMEICGLKPSKKVGMIKRAIEDAILDGIIPNDIEAARNYLFKLKENLI